MVQIHIVKMEDDMGWENGSQVGEKGYGQFCEARGAWGACIEKAKDERRVGATNASMM